MDSLWIKTSESAARPPLYGDTETEVAVIGGGMAGILTALFLQEHGVHTVVLEAGRTGGGTTCRTTAKLTSQHGAIYAELLERFGREKAQMYAHANQRAIENYRRVIEKYHISCDFEETDALLYSHAHEDVMRREAEAAASLGLPASFTSRLELPLRISGAVRFTGQAQFHPLKFLYPLADQLTVYERTPAERVEGHTVFTPKGRVKADKIVFACHYPFVNFPGLYFARMHQERSYVLALENAPLPQGMYYGYEAYAYSLRRWGNVTLLGGGAHRTGENPDGGHYRELREAARILFPESRGGNSDRTDLRRGAPGRRDLRSDGAFPAARGQGGRRGRARGEGSCPPRPARRFSAAGGASGRPRRPGTGGRKADGRVPRLGNGILCGGPCLSAPRLPAGMEPGREKLGLSLPRLSL